MKKAKDALKWFRTRVRGLVPRRSGGDGDENEKRPKDRNRGSLWRLIPLACGLAASVFVFASLTQCEYLPYDFPLLGSSWCELSSRTFAFMSISGGSGFLVFLTMEVARMIFAQMWKDREIDRAERRAEAAEHRADAAARMMELVEQARKEDAERSERREEAAERRAELAERARREDAERAERRAEAAERMAETAARREEAAERMAEAAERRELLLIELIASLKNGKDDANGSDSANSEDDASE